MSKEMQPCPYCNCKRFAITKDGVTPYNYQIMCAQCFSKGPRGMCIAEAELLWNRRESNA